MTDASPDSGEEATTCDECDDDEDCTSGRCVELRGSSFCLDECGEGCEEGYACEDPDGDGELCVPESGSCLDCTDGDNDGYGVGGGCLGPDCADDDETRFPGATDGCDGVDNDCDEETDEDFEAESCGEGACAAESACTEGVFVACEPGMPAENDATCDGVDDDCDGTDDEDFVPESCGVGPCTAESSCAEGVLTECTPAEAPADDDVTCDSVDDDCDGAVDEDFLGAVCGVGACGNVGICVEGVEECTEGQPVADDDSTCNGIDENCNGEVDEDFDGDDRACGLGVCRVVATCVEGVFACEPLMANSEDDASCNGADDNCDGFIDEDCDENLVSIELVSVDAEGIDINVVYAHNTPPETENTQSRPRLADLTITVPASLTLREDGGMVRGQAIIDAQKNARAFPGDGEVRVLIVNQANTNRIDPGVLYTLRFTHADDAGPFAFGWNEPLSNFAPEEAQNILSLMG
ncbi:MAG: hypothetical protein GY913_16580, partial [Proteobacteria bacterium]|nr:hypothetical protein [Pseudomonadota bacterium]